MNREEAKIAKHNQNFVIFAARRLKKCDFAAMHPHPALPIFRFIIYAINCSVHGWTDFVLPARLAQCPMKTSLALWRFCADLIEYSTLPLVLQDIQDIYNVGPLFVLQLF